MTDRHESDRSPEPGPGPEPGRGPVPRHELGPDVSAEERRALILLAERLERDRPLPGPTFRGELRRHLLGAGRPATPATRFRLWAASYTLAGSLCLAVAAVGLAGVGPFAA